MVNREDGYYGKGTRSEDKTKNIFDILFKVNQVLMPLMLGWCIWVTNNIYEFKTFMGQGDRFTTQNAKIMEVDIKEWVRENYPPIELKNDVKELKLAIDGLRMDLYKLQSVMKKGDKQ